MSADKQKFAEILKQGTEQEKPMGAIEAVKEGIQAIAPGLTLNNILSDVRTELGRLGVQGQMEMASALFNGSAFVPYGPGQYTPTPDQTNAEPTHSPEPQQQEQQQDRGGLGM
jgi:hypothetical protein